MNQSELIPHLFRTEYRKIVNVLFRLFGIDHIELAEDIVSDTFLMASELWGLKGIPQNPQAWLYVVAKNKTKDYLKKSNYFAQKISKDLKHANNNYEDFDIDLSERNIEDSQLAMMFAICQPIISQESQICLSLNLLCGFGAEEIASAFLTNREVIYKKLQRAKQKLKEKEIKIEHPKLDEITERLPAVLMTIYLLFNEGYYSNSVNFNLRKDLCVEAMRLNYLLLENKLTNTSSANALMALMCFHSSRFDARMDKYGEIILYDEQDESLWDEELIAKGNDYMNRSSEGKSLTKFHIEAGIAYWHTVTKDSSEKWENILKLYNLLLLIEYSPIIAINRTYALSKVYGKNKAIIEAEKINLQKNHLYHALLGELYTGVDVAKAIENFNLSINYSRKESDKRQILKKLEMLVRHSANDL